MDYETASQFTTGSKNVSMDMINVFEQMEALNERNSVLFARTAEMQNEIADNMKAIKDMQTNLKRQISRMTNQDLAERGIDDKVSFTRESNPAFESPEARIANFEKLRVDRIGVNDINRETNKQEQIDKELDSKLIEQNNQDIRLEEQRANEVDNIKDKLSNLRTGRVHNASYERGRIGVYTNERIASMRSKIDLLTGKASVLMNEIELQSKRMNYGLNGNKGIDEKLTTSISKRVKEQYEMLTQRVSTVQKARLEAKKEEERILEEQRKAENMEQEIADEEMKQAEDAIREAEAKEKEDQEVKEEKQEEAIKIRPRFRIGESQKVTASKSKVKTSPRDIIVAAMASIGNWDLKFKNAVLKGEIGFEQVQQQLMGLYEQGKAKGYQFTQDLLTKYREYSEKRQQAKADKMADKMIAQEQKEEQRNARMADILEEKERREITAQAKEDFIAAIKEQEREERREKIANFKAGAKQKVSSAKAKVATVDHEKVVAAMATLGNWDLKFKNAVLRGEIGFETVKQELIGLYEDGKAKGQEFTQDLLTKYREFQEQRKQAKADKMADKMIAQEQKEEALNAKMAEELEERERKEITAQAKEDFIAALKEQQREERAQKIANFKAGAVQKVSSAKQKVGTFATGALGKLNGARIVVSEKAKKAFAGLTNAVKTKAEQIKAGVQDGIASVQDLMEELANDVEVKQQIARENLQQEYINLLNQYAALQQGGPELATEGPSMHR